MLFAISLYSLCNLAKRKWLICEESYALPSLFLTQELMDAEWCYVGFVKVNEAGIGVVDSVRGNLAN